VYPVTICTWSLPNKASTSRRVEPHFATVNLFAKLADAGPKFACNREGFSSIVEFKYDGMVIIYSVGCGSRLLLCFFLLGLLD
jgi:hypothetical protein